MPKIATKNVKRITDESKTDSRIDIKINGNGKAEAYWSKCLNFIKDNVSNQVYSTWFKPIKATEYKNNQLVLQVPSQFFCEWIDEHYSDLLSKTIAHTIGEGVSLKYNVVIDDNSDTLENRTIKVPALRKKKHNNIKT